MWANRRVSCLGLNRLHCALVTRSGRLRWRLAVGVLAVLIAVGAAGMPAPIPLPRDGGGMSIESHLAFALDPGGKAGIEDRAALDWFGADEGRTRGGGFGYTSDAVWARLEIENGQERPVDAQLKLSIARLGRVMWWVLDGAQVVDFAEEGVDVAGGRSGGGRYPAMLIHLPAGERREVYVRVESDTAIWISPALVSSWARAGQASIQDSAEYFFVGAGAAMFFMALIFGLIRRNRLHLLAAAIIGAFMGYYLSFHGYYVLTGGPWQRWANRHLVLVLGLAGHGALLEFTALFFRQSGVAGPAAKWLQRVAVGVVVGALAACVLPFRWGLVAMMAVLVACFSAGVPASLRMALRTRAWPHGLLAAAWLLLGLLLTTTYAELYAWLPVWVEPTHLQRAFLMAIFLMTVAVVAGQRLRERRDRERALLAEQSATMAQLQALRYQLNPHFLYNALNSIDALSRLAPQRIPELVRKLATYLRLRLHPSSDGMATLEDELNSVRAYLDIEKVRFEECLRVNHEVEEGVEVYRVPEMVFQPLVENALKHGMPAEGALELTVRVGRVGRDLSIAVENNGRLDDGGAGGRSEGGIGLRNVAERLARVYGAAARFELRQEEGRVVAEIRLPIEEGTR